MITQLSSRCIPLKTIFLIGAMGSLLPISSIIAQQPFPQIQIQLPTRRVFQINTVVSVPDGGLLSLGGNILSGDSRTSRGVWLMNGRPFRNQSRGGYYSPHSASVRVQMFSNREVDEQLMAEAARRELSRDTMDPNGSADVQRRADLLTRNIGRTK